MTLLELLQLLRKHLRLVIALPGVRFGDGRV